MSMRMTVTTTMIICADLAAAARAVTKTPAEAVGLNDRGEIVPGRRADLIRVGVGHNVAVVRSAWRLGRRVA
jgi:alpha-D-ribose 1-methylphosphonate 5-triphosphate diphosphatase